MSDTTTLSTLINTQVKRAATSYCKRRGLKLRHFVEQALVEQLEDEIDLEAYLRRRGEKMIPLEKILAGRTKKK